MSSQDSNSGLISLDMDPFPNSRILYNALGIVKCVIRNRRQEMVQMTEMVDKTSQTRTELQGRLNEMSKLISCIESTINEATIKTWDVEYTNHFSEILKKLKPVNNSPVLRSSSSSDRSNEPVVFLGELTPNSRHKGSPDRLPTPNRQLSPSKQQEDGQRSPMVRFNTTSCLPEIDVPVPILATAAHVSPSRVTCSLPTSSQPVTSSPVKNGNNTSLGSHAFITPIQVTKTFPDEDALDCLLCLTKKFLKRATLVNHVKVAHHEAASIHDEIFTNFLDGKVPPEGFECMYCTGSGFKTKKIFFQHIKRTHVQRFNTFIQILTMTGFIKDYRGFFQNLDLVFGSLDEDEEEDQKPIIKPLSESSNTSPNTFGLPVLSYDRLRRREPAPKKSSVTQDKSKASKNINDTTSTASDGEQINGLPVAKKRGRGRPKASDTPRKKLCGSGEPTDFSLKALKARLSNANAQEEVEESDSLESSSPESISLLKPSSSQSKASSIKQKYMKKRGRPSNKESKKGDDEHESTDSQDEGDKRLLTTKSVTIELALRRLENQPLKAIDGQVSPGAFKCLKCSMSFDSSASRAEHQLRFCKFRKPRPRSRPIFNRSPKSPIKQTPAANLFETLTNASPRSPFKIVSPTSHSELHSSPEKAPENPTSSAEASHSEDDANFSIRLEDMTPLQKEHFKRDCLHRQPVVYLESVGENIVRKLTKTKRFEHIDYLED